MEKVAVGQDFTVLVDYAHTDDALKNLLETVRGLGPRRVITVFGCGGDRDRTKRPLMGAVAARLSDVVILTSDNPRSEPPEAILDEIRRGIPAARAQDTLVIPDRRDAIARALEMGREGVCRGDRRQGPRELPGRCASAACRSTTARWRATCSPASPGREGRGERGDECSAASAWNACSRRPPAAWSLRRRAGCVLRSVSIDSRTLEPGALFVAIRGPRFDGHDFLAAAQAKGAVAALVEREPEAPPPGLPARARRPTPRGRSRCWRVTSVARRASRSWP